MNTHETLYITSKVYSITIKHEKISKTSLPIPNVLFNEKYAQILQQKHKMEEQLAKIKLQLQKQMQLAYIMQGYFAKIEKIMYNTQSHLFQAKPLNYQKIELHMRQILRRLADIHNQKLNSVPVIYRKNNVKVYKYSASNT